MQTSQTLQAEISNHVTSYNIFDFPWSFIICMLPGIIFAPYLAERYQNLFHQAKNEQLHRYRCLSLLSFGIWLIIGLDISIWVYTVQYPLKMNLEYQQVYITVLYIIFFLSWGLSLRIEKLEQLSDHCNMPKIQNRFWTFSFFTNLFQYIIFSSVTFLPLRLQNSLTINFATYS